MFRLSNNFLLQIFEKRGVRGYNNITINKSDLYASGIYFYRIEAGENSETHLMMNE